MIDTDAILRADFIITMDGDLSVIEDGAIAVKDGLIVSVGPATEICTRYSSRTELGGAGKVIFPGLVNTHTHAAMVYFRGLGDDLPLKVWLEEHIWPAEEKWLSEEFVGEAVELACLEMLKAGITAYNDMYFYGDSVARTTKRFGMRAVVCSGILDFPSRTAKTAEEYLRNAEGFIKDWTGDDLIRPGVAPHSPYTCSPATIQAAMQLAERYDVPLHVHLSETEWEVREVKGRYGKSPIALLDSIGCLDRRVVAAHCVWPSDEEIDMLFSRGVWVSHCIESNLKLASGIAPVIKMLNSGVKVTFGTDGAASNNDLDIISEMSTAAKVHKAVSGDPTALSARQAMLMATKWGAESMGLGDVTGSIEAGKSADMVIAGLNRPHLVPMYDIFSHLVYSMDAADIESVMVKGRVVVDNGELTVADEAGILDRAVEWGRRIRSSNGLAPVKERS